jgi:hypothetical protein
MTTIGTIGRKLDLLIKQGSSFAFPFSVTGSDGLPLALNGYVIRSQIRPFRLSPTLTVSFTVNITDFGNGAFLLSLTPAQTAAIPAGETVTAPQSKYVWDLEMESPAGYVTPLAWGSVVVFPEVTR